MEETVNTIIACGLFVAVLVFGVLAAGLIISIKHFIERGPSQ